MGLARLEGKSRHAPTSRFIANYECDFLARINCSPERAFGVCQKATEGISGHCHDGLCSSGGEGRGETSCYTQMEARAIDKDDVMQGEHQSVTS